MLTQLLLATVSVPVYIASGAVAGMVNETLPAEGLGNVPPVTLPKEADNAAASQLILNNVGLPVPLP